MLKLRTIEEAMRLVKSYFCICIYVEAGEICMYV